MTDIYNLSVRVGVKKLNFAWQAFPGASYYRLFENSNGLGNYSQIPESGDISELNYKQEIAVQLFNRRNARCRLQAFKDNGNSDPIFKC